MAEQFALGQRFGNGRAVDRDERLIAAAAEVMDRLGHDLLARAVFAQDQHGQIGVGHAADDRAQGLDGRAFADQPHAFGRLLGDLPIGREQLLAVLGVFQGHGGMGGQFDQRLFVFLRETAGEFVDQLERAEQFARPAAQRHAQQRPRLVAQLRIDVAVDGLRLGGRVDAARLARLNHLAHHAAIVGNAQFAAGKPRAGRPTSVWFGRSQRKMLARSAPNSRVAASAIWTSSGSTSRVWFHWLAISRMASKRRSRLQVLLPRSEPKPVHRPGPGRDFAAPPGLCPIRRRCGNARPKRRPMNYRIVGAQLTAPTDAPMAPPLACASGRLTIEHFGQKFQGQRAAGSGLSDDRPTSGDRGGDKGVIAPRLGKYGRKNVIQKNGCIVGMGGFPKQLGHNRPKMGLIANVVKNDTLLVLVLVISGIKCDLI